MMSSKTFFNQARAILGPLTTRQVEGINALLAALDRHNVANLNERATVFANVHRETGGGFYPVKETVYVSSRDKNPSDATVIKRLETAWKAGKLGKVKTPYWRDGAFGRGYIQLTHWKNYEKLGKALGVDLRGNPERALELDLAADIAVVGMRDGLFTGKRLSQFHGAGGSYNAFGARAIVNGGNDAAKEVADNHGRWHAAFMAAKPAPAAPPIAKPSPPPVKVVTPPAPPPPPITPIPQTPPQSANSGFFNALIAAILKFFGVKK